MIGDHPGFQRRIWEAGPSMRPAELESGAWFRTCRPEEDDLDINDDTEERILERVRRQRTLDCCRPHRTTAVSRSHRVVLMIIRIFAALRVHPGACLVSMSHEIRIHSIWQPELLQVTSVVRQGTLPA